MRGPLVLLVANLALIAVAPRDAHAPHAPSPPRMLDERGPKPAELALDAAEHRTPDGCDGRWSVAVIRPPDGFPDSRPWPYGMVMGVPDTGDRMVITPPCGLVPIGARLARALGLVSAVSGQTGHHIVTPSP